MNTPADPLREFVNADTPEPQRQEVAELALLRDVDAGRVPPEDLPAYLRERARLRALNISVSPFTAVVGE